MVINKINFNYKKMLKDIMYYILNTFLIIIMLKIMKLVVSRKFIIRIYLLIIIIIIIVRYCYKFISYKNLSNL